MPMLFLASTIVSAFVMKFFYVLVYVLVIVFDCHSGHVFELAMHVV